jgi:hypothetical protein
MKKHEKMRKKTERIEYSGGTSAQAPHVWWRTPHYFIIPMHINICKILPIIFTELQFDNVQKSGK